ncbi:hypothetical protein PV08_11679 [Exophiala spinifera]|uniref:Uncharacterized protein n=1 Tax=Exophiala spinifera TaxID=91928 RepID=A0A0D2AT57_9EURO|nr:uncharacterized protein PV08_11679 [Exophiala spinifera]KIW09903.1 hypothetical protein PV08_11679 [Exophiala spinifera]
MSKALYSVVSLRGAKQDSEVLSDENSTRYGSNATMHEPSSAFAIDSPDGDRMQVFLLRTVTCICVPILMTGYYAGLWAYWIEGYDNSGPVPWGPPAGLWAYYIWFVVSAVGIGMSKYGLAGIEAALLMDPRWAPGNAMQLMIHCDRTWSGPAGWVQIRSRPSPAWLLLGLISVIPYVALPLSGFTLQLMNGYTTTRSSTAYRANLVGLRPETFLDQNLEDVFTRSFNRWRSSSPSVLYEKSAYYLPAGSRSEADRSWLKAFPNNWPDEANITTFIAPQSSSIVEGEAWGLQTSLNCSVVSSISQFELLSQRNDDGTAPRCPPINFNSSEGLPEYSGLPDLCDFDVYLLSPIANETLLNLNILDSVNFPVGMMELAVKHQKDSDFGFDVPFSNVKPVLLEAALWQNPIEMVQKCAPLEKVVSNDLGTIVRGFKKTFTHTNLTAMLTGQTDMSPKELDAIGVQCRSSYRTGSATVDGRTGTYTKFVDQEADALVSATPVPLATAIPRIFRSEVSAALSLQDMYGEQAFVDTINSLNVEWTADSNMDLNPMAYVASNISWLQNLYKSVDAFYRQPLYCDDEGNVNLTTTTTWQQLQLINSTQLVTSMMRAHKAYALEMSKPTVQARSAFFLGNLTTVPQTLIVSRGDVPAQPVLALLAVWAFCCSVLGVLYGPRRRWSETLDGYSMFRFGTDQPQVRQACRTTRRFTECSGLRELPGLVGDAARQKSFGYITLVDQWQGAASVEKKYI